MGPQVSCRCVSPALRVPGKAQSASHKIFTGFCAARSSLLLSMNKFAYGVAHQPSANARAGMVSKELQQKDDGLREFQNQSLTDFNIAILGDLHLDPESMGLFLEARKQVVEGCTLPDGSLQPGARVVQLGDLGSYHHGPGGMGCFLLAKDYLDGFSMPAATILGNHDLEGMEFETDAENMAAWAKIFRQRHYWSCDVGPLTLIGLSTVRFRENPFSAHEVHIDKEQLQFLKSELERVRDRPVALFTHAPIMGSGLKVVQQVHVKNRCAWLNHSSDPQQFIRLVRDHPNIRLWFSGHFHLSHNYADSVSVVGGCAFVQTGVIGECNRDGFRQSRVLKGDLEGYRLYTLDHDTGSLRLDLQQRWDDPSGPVPLTPEEELICDPAAGWLCSRVDCSVGTNGSYGASDAARSSVQWFAAGGNCLLARQGDILVEYDAVMMAPIGVVALSMPDSCQVMLVDAAGQPVDTVNTDGSTAVAVELRIPPAVAQALRAAETQSGGGAAFSQEQHINSGKRDSVLYDRIERNKAGTFYRVFQKNKWRMRKEREAAAAGAQQVQKQPQQPMPTK